jgi:CpeS-like protein
MYNLQQFFTLCVGFWITERTYHYMETGEIERSHTEYSVHNLKIEEKQQILSVSSVNGIAINPDDMKNDDSCPGFAIAFDTINDKGEQVSMSLKALFVPDQLVLPSSENIINPTIPLASQIAESEEVITGYYLRDEGYSESGSIAGRFTYIPTRQTLEMTTFYGRSVAVDQMRLIADDLRLRTIITYKRPSQLDIEPTKIKLVGFGVEKKVIPT